jgi:hypothetical protein
VERARYAPGGDATPDVSALKGAVDRVRTELAVTAGVKRELRGILLPRTAGVVIGTWWLRARARTVAAGQGVLRTLHLRRA